MIYRFYAFEFEGWVWLYNSNEVTYCASTIPSQYAEPLYPLNDEDCSPHPTYFSLDLIEKAEKVFVMEIPGDNEQDHGEHLPPSEQREEYELWDEAREEACSNHPI